MKTIKILLVLAISATMFNCTTVESGHKGVEVSWGGETNMQKIYPEGMDSGIHWIWDDMVEYDVREKTIVQAFEFNDKNNMVTRVELSLDFNFTKTYY